MVGRAVLSEPVSRRFPANMPMGEYTSNVGWIPASPGISRIKFLDRRQAGRKVTARQSRASHLIPAMSRNIPDRNFDRGYRGPRGPRAEWCRWRLPQRLWRARHQPACVEHESVSRAVGAAVVTASGPWLGPCGASWDARSASCSAAFFPLIFLPCYPFHLTTRR